MTPLVRILPIDVTIPIKHVTAQKRAENERTQKGEKGKITNKNKPKTNT